jgi:hypothetical protein
MSTARQKETIEYDSGFLKAWNAFCESTCMKKRLAAHACRFAFMKLTVEEREKAMLEAMRFVVASRKRRGGG